MSERARCRVAPSVLPRNEAQLSPDAPPFLPLDPGSESALNFQAPPSPAARKAGLLLETVLRPSTALHVETATQAGLMFVRREVPQQQQKAQSTARPALFQCGKLPSIAP